jgi:hypothetical protein
MNVFFYEALLITKANALFQGEALKFQNVATGAGDAKADLPPAPVGSVAPQHVRQNWGNFYDACVRLDRYLRDQGDQQPFEDWLYIRKFLEGIK